VTLEGIASIAKRARETAPGLGTLRFREAWAGLRPATPDHLPVLGASPTVEGLIYATGHFRSGILLSAITGDVMSKLILGRKQDVDLRPFLASRFSKTAPSK